MKSLIDIMDEGKTVYTGCPVCGRDIVLNRDGTLFNHFTSFMNQDDPTQPLCIGGGIKVVEDNRMTNCKHE